MGILFNAKLQTVLSELFRNFLSTHKNKDTDKNTL